MALGSVQLILTQAADESTRADAASRATMMFILLAVGLALLFVVVILLVVSARRQSASTRASGRSLDLDAWKTAGERAEPMDGGAASGGDKSSG